MDSAPSPGPDGSDPAREAVNRYGRFSPDGSEYWITDPATPRPWVNVIANQRVGLVVSQTGSGFTWIDNSQLAVITRWQQDLVSDASGKFLYLRDAASGEVWSLSPAPTWPTFDLYRCRHGLGYTTFETVHQGVAAQWTLFVDAREPVEYWRVELRNLGDRPRSLELTGFLEWNMGVAPSPRREFTRLFLENSFDRELRAVFARSHMWEVPSQRWGHWNTEFPYVAALGCSEPLITALGDKGEFVGRYGSLRAPAALSRIEWHPDFGRHGDPVAALRTPVLLAPGELRQFGFVLAVGTSQSATRNLLGAALAPGAVDRALDEVRTGWRERLAAHRVATTEPTLDFLTNDWLRYQAIAARLWGRCGYYQQSGAYGYRDQLQDSQVWLTIEPERCREQINLHAAHQFADGSVYHWWHPLTEQGHVTKMTDDLLWLAFVTASYIKETGRFDVLDDVTPFVDDPQPEPLREHVARAFNRVLKRTGPRGIPYIGAGDWNDGLSAVGLEEHGESFWLAQFFAGLLADWAEIHRRIGEGSRASDLAACRDLLVGAVNQHGWDGAWYLRATLDDGSPLGSRSNRFGRIYLNAQTWAVLHDVAPPDRAAACMAAVREHLVTGAGALLLAPAYAEPAREIGYITRYAPGLRENGGVYSHAATWAIAAACKVRDAELVGQLLAAVNPALKDPDRYWAEPYVMPGNVDGPDSPHFGRGGWTWYTGSAAWLHRIVTQWVLGVRPEWDGLRVDPCLPSGWPGARMTRPWRGAIYRISIERADDLPDGVRTEVTLDGVRLDGTLLPFPSEPGEQHDVRVRCR